VLRAGSSWGERSGYTMRQRSMTATSRPSMPISRIISRSAQAALIAGPGSPTPRAWIALYTQRMRTRRARPTTSPLAHYPHDTPHHATLADALMTEAIKPTADSPSTD
jgi:hypothetical protein